MLKLIISLVLLSNFAAFVANASSISVAEKPALPDDLFFELKTVPVEQNAIISWRRAGQVVIYLNEKQRQTIEFCWTPSAKEPATEDLNDLKTWLKRNQDALELFDASLSKPIAQWPERNPQNHQPELVGLPSLVKARLFAADQLAQENQFEGAAKSLEGTLKLAQMGIEGDAALTHYLIACRSRSMTEGAILRLATRKEVPLPMLERFLKDLPSIDSETNVYDKVLRVEFTRGYYESLDLKELTEKWSKASETNAALVLALYPERFRRAHQVLLDPSLVALHPKPYDATAEIEKSIRYFRIYRTNSLIPWTERSGEVELAQEIERTKLIQDIAPLMELVKDEPLPLSRQAVQRARAAYLEIDNPIGRIFDTSLLGFIASDSKVCQARTEREATRARLAVMIFERRKGRLPATLSDVVEEKILPSLPADLFCGKSLHYSRERRVIWSVSYNGVDDNGETGESFWFDKDAVWQIPEID